MMIMVEIGPELSPPIATAPAPDDSIRALSGAGAPARRQDVTVAAGGRAR
jgi:hypothetical protein